MSEQRAGGSVDRDEERETPTADEVLKDQGGLDEAVENARQDRRNDEQQREVAPEWAPGLQDEDVASAQDGNYER
jgi:hypothetical protein